MRCARLGLCIALLLVGACHDPPAPTRAPVRARAEDPPCAGVEPSPIPTSLPEVPEPEIPLAPEAVLPVPCHPRPSLPFHGAVAIESGGSYRTGVRARGVVLRAPQILIVLSYPLSRDAVFTLTPRRSEGFELGEIVEAIRAAYARVYAIEDHEPEIDTPERGPRLVNRGARYGIWGHDLGDLFLESIDVCAGDDGTVVVSPGVGS